jgi:thymidylate synthase (FAD)
MDYLKIIDLKLDKTKDLHEKDFTHQKVLDHGYIQYIEHSGLDATIAEDARVSYGKGTKQVNKESKGLIDRLIRDGHWSPFEMPDLKVEIGMPIFVANQWKRYRTAKINEYSGRYSEMMCDFYIPDMERLEYQNKENRQGGDNTFHIPDDIKQSILNTMLSDSALVFESYSHFLEHDLTRELARIGLPLNLYTKMVWKLDLRNLFNLLSQRLDNHAQWEIRQYAIALSNIVKTLWPESYSSFENHVLNSVRLSHNDIKYLMNTLGLGSKLDDLLPQFKTKEFKETYSKTLYDRIARMIDLSVL